MSKGLGQKLAIKFTEDLVGDVDINNVTYSSEKISFARITLTTNSSSNYGNGLDSIYDGSLSTYFGTITALPNWIRFEVMGDYPVNKLRFYNGASYRPNAFTFEGSHDGSSWVSLYSGNMPNATGWVEHTFENTTVYRYYRLSVTSRHSTITYIYEVELFWDFPQYTNVPAFQITGQRQRHIGSEVYDAQTYSVYKAERHPTEEKTLLLTTFPLARFNNAVGPITVAYDKLLGTLGGQGGVVESFSREFTPMDLIPVPNPNPREKIVVGGAITHSLKDVFYRERYAQDRLTVSASISHTLIDTTIVNP